MTHKTGDTVRANIRATVNHSMIRREQRDGRDVIVVNSATLPDDIVMNGIMYPADEIEKSYKTLENTPAPLGHPTVSNMFVPASSPLGLNIGYFGAWNANVERREGRVLVEKIIDVERANESKMGRRVLAALEQGRPIHTSTGLTMNIRECRDSDLADWEGFNMTFDHDAILLDEDGAATPEQGVGMLVNKATNKDGDLLDVVNGTYEEKTEDQLDYLGMELLAALERKKSATMWSRVKEAIMEAAGLGRDDDRPLKTEADMAGTDDKTHEKTYEALNELQTTVSKLAETVQGLVAQNEKTAATLDALNAEKHAARAALVNKVVEAKLLSEAEAKETPDVALNALLNSQRKSPEPAPGIMNGYSGGESLSLAEDWEK